MKTIIKCILAILSVSFMTTACDDMTANIQDDLNKGEAVYPGRIMDLYVKPGKNKAKIYWRLNSDRRIAKTVIAWKNISGEDGKVEKEVSSDRRDSVFYIDVYGDGYLYVFSDSIETPYLEEGVYPFSAYTVDKEGHQSIIGTSAPYTIFGPVATGTLSARGFTSMEMLSSRALRVTWEDIRPSDDGSVPTLLYTVIRYNDFRDNPEGTPVTDTIRNNRQTTTDLAGLFRISPFTVKSVYQVGIDTSWTAVSTYYPPIVEKTILEANGFTELTAEAAAGILKLVLPFGTENSWTLRDLFYFPNLEELEFTAPSELPTLTYERNGVSSTVGGGPWPYYVSGYMSDNNRAILRSLLALGQFKKIKYTRNLYPRFDDELVASLERGELEEVEWFPAEPLPNDFMVTPNLLVDYRVEDNARGATVDHQEDGSNVPDEIAEKFDGELRNVYKVRVTASNSSIAFSLPEEVQFVFEPHGVLNFDAYLEATDTAYTWMKPAGTSKYESWNRIMCRRKSRLDNFPNTSPYGSNSNGAGPTWNVNTELGTWKNLSWALQTVPQEHIRVIVMQMGNDGAWGLPSGQTLTYYIANLRWTHK